MSFPKHELLQNRFLSVGIKQFANMLILAYKTTDAPEEPELNFINCWYFLSFNRAITLAFS
jgi:hypothetical protein